MNFALIGCGQYGKNYVKAIKENHDSLLYICNRTPGEPREVAREDYGIFTTDFAEILTNEKLDAVIIATPPDSHYSLVKQALAAGKSVICEKPFVFSSEEAKELYLLAEEKKVKLLVNYTRLFSSYSEQLFKLISENSSRKITVHLENGNWGPMRDYSSLWDYGSHELALALCFIDINKAKIVKAKEEHGACKNYQIQITDRNIEVHLSFGNAFVSKRRGVIVYVDGAPHLFNEDPKVNPLRNLISFFKEVNMDHLFYNLSVPTTYVLEQLEKT